MPLHGMVRDIPMQARVIALQPGRRCDAGSNRPGRAGGAAVGRGRFLGFRDLRVFGFSSVYIWMVANKDGPVGCK